MKPSDTIRALKKSGKDIIALVASDLHLSHKMPSARCDKHWYDVMGEYLMQLEHARQEAGMIVPIFVAGDIFHLWNSPPELINFAIKFMPEVWAVPGQHDLPLHDWGQIRRSAFWTLLEIGRIRMLGKAGTCFRDEYNLVNLVAYGFGWGVGISQPKETPGAVNLAIIHSYIWKHGASYPGAKVTDELRTWRDQLSNYHTAVFGDNHIGFFENSDKGTNIMNCGTFLRRRSDEKDYQPMIGAIDSEGTIHPVPLDCSKDAFLDVVPPSTYAIDSFDDLMKELAEGADGALDFAESVNRHDWKQYQPGVELYITDIMEGK